jgi:hypothetical protein
MSQGYLLDDFAEPRAQGAYGPRSEAVPVAGARPAPHSGSPTSRAAARRIAPVAGTIRADVLAYLRSRGADGATADEIERALGIGGSTVRPRLIELLGREPDGSDQFIVETERTRETRSRRKAVVYLAVGE